jgi:hypothetical protein
VELRGYPVCINSYKTKVLKLWPIVGGEAWTLSGGLIGTENQQGLNQQSWVDHLETPMRKTSHIPESHARKGRTMMTTLRAAVIVALSASHVAAWH